jgi:hypothetical protein
MSPSSGNKDNHFQLKKPNWLDQGQEKCSSKLKPPGFVTAIYIQRAETGAPELH